MKKPLKDYRSIFIKWLFVATLLVPVQTINSQEGVADTSEPAETASQYAVMLTAQKPSLNMLIDFDDHEIYYQPNTLMNMNVAFYYKGFSVSIGKDFGGGPKQTEQYGETSYIDYRLSYYQKKYGLDLIYNRYKGFYLENPGAYGNIAGDSTAKRGDLKIANTGLSAFYVFSDDFLLDGTFDVMGTTRKTGGSLLLMTAFTSLAIDSDKSLVPPNREELFGKKQGYRGGKYRGLSILPGAGYTLAKGGLYANAIFFFGPGVLQKQQIVKSGTEVSYEPFGKSKLKFSLGYSKRRLYGGFVGSVDNTVFKSALGEQDSIEIKVDSKDGEFYFGTRF